MQDIGDLYGVTRQRVQQILKQAGVTGAKKFTEQRKVVVSEIRANTPQVKIAKRTGKSSSFVSKTASMNGFNVCQHWRWKHSDAELLCILREFHRKHGKIPGAMDFHQTNGLLPPFGRYQKRFGTWTNAINLAFGIKVQKGEGRGPVGHGWK